MTVREFDGGAFIRFGAGTNGMDEVLFGAFTYVIVCKRLSGHTDTGALLDIATGLSGSRGLFRYKENGEGNVLDYLRGQFQSAGSGPAFTSSDDWCVIAFARSAGTSTVTYSKGVKSSGSTSWTHQTTTGTVGNDDNTCDRMQTQFMEDSDFTARIRVAAMAMFNSRLTTTAIEALDSNYQDILDASPIWAVKYDQASTATAVTDDIGDGDQSLLSGSSVITTDDPPNWAYTAATDQELDISFHQQTNQLFTPTIQNDSPLELNTGLIGSTAQLFAPTLEAQNAQELSLTRLESTLQLFAPTIAIGSQTLNPPFISSTLQIFAPVIENQNAHELAIPHIGSGLQLFNPTLSQQSLDLNIGFRLTNIVVMFQPTMQIEGGVLFDPILLGNGTLADQIMAGLIDQGFLTGSLADRERARLLAKLSLVEPQNLSIQDLYELANEPNRLAGLVLV